MNNMEEKYTTISGTYGDEVNLYHGGYVGTKYGDFLKIKSIDFENHTVELYGDEGLGFSRLSSSMPECDEANKYYIEAMKYYIERLGIKIGSIVNLSKLSLEDLKYDSFVITLIRMPEMIEEDDYLIKLGIRNLKNKREYLYTILDFSDFQMKLEVISTPYTLEEKLKNHLEEHSDYSGTIKDKDKYLQSLLELIRK
jgi:hypothetical protein